MRLVPATVLLCAAVAGPAWGQNAGNPSFTLANRGNQPIQELYATPQGVDNWGPDRMERWSLSPGMTMPIRLPANGPCVYDIRVVYADGSPEEKRRLNTCQVDSVAFPGARVAGNGSGPDGGQGGNQGGNQGGQGSGGRGQAANDPSFRLVNRGRYEVREVYASPTGDDDWGKDRLGDDTVPPGRSFIVRLPSGQCQYDVRVVFSNDQALERRRVNLCNVTDFRVP